MIRGDIDLTENLDFRKDKQEIVPVYRNDPAFVKKEPKPRNTFAKTYRSASTWSYNYSLDDAIVTYNLNGRIYNYTYRNSMSNSTTLSLYYDSDEPDVFHYQYDIINEYYYNYNNLTSESIPVEVEVKYNPASELFCHRHNVNYHTNANLGERKNIVYHNTSFEKPKTLKDSSFMKYWKMKRDTRDSFIEALDQLERSLDLLEFGTKSYIHRLFGTRKDPIKEEEKKIINKYDAIPWIRELKTRNRNAYDYYIEELEDNEKDYSRYLTDMGWLRLH